MTDVPSPVRSQNPAQAIYQEARSARQTSEQLLPLLSLLEETETPGSVDEIKALLTTIVEILGQHSQSLTSIQTAVLRAGLNPTS